MRSERVLTQGPFLRDEIEGIEENAYFYTGAEGPPTRGQRHAIMRYFDDKVAGEEGRQRSEHELKMVRALAGEILSGRPDAVALLGNTSDALHRLVGMIDLKPGDNVVTTDLEFPSGVLTLLALRDAGVEVRIVPSDGGGVSSERVEEHVDGRTRLIVASHVSYVSGGRIDARAVHHIARNRGAAFILDVTQSLGVLNVSADCADALVCSTYKWLLGPHGIGLVHLSNPEMFTERSTGVGWRSVEDVFAADRFENIHLHEDARSLELGFPSFPSVYLLNDALSTLTTNDRDDVEKYAMSLSGAVVDELRTNGFTLLTPPSESQRGTNISIAAEQGELLAKQLLERGVQAWGGDGRLRISVHGFNTSAEVERLLAALKELS